VNANRRAARVDSFLMRVDGRVKTPIFLLAIIAACLLEHWFLAAALWLSGLAALLDLRLPRRKVLVRLSAPFAGAWFVLVTLMFTNGGHPVWSLSLGGLRICVYREGLMRGILIMLRIMSAVTLAQLLSQTTPMNEILESLRLYKVPDLLVDLAAMMYRYIAIIEETSRKLHRAQASRMGGDAPWTRRVGDIGKMAGSILIGSIDRSTRIHQAMLSRGYDEDSRNVAFFTSRVSPRDRRLEIAGMLSLVAFVCLDLVILGGTATWN
jgi:cobalt/nickel transport system permease protein